MSTIAKLGDQCFGIMMYPPPIGPVPGTGTIITGDPNNLIDGIPAARIGDTVMFPIGPAYIMTGAPNEISSGMPLARLGDVVSGPLVTNGMIIAGSPNELSV
jgi:uncharacterized Zn-binding protein involved in type VI secretion